MTGPRFAMAVDTRRCVGCNACVFACKEENGLPSGVFRDWIVTETRGRFPNLTQEIRSERCHHCSNAPCVTCCPTGASHYGYGGTVQVDPTLCTGCKACIASCPYDARTVHPDGYVEKCTFCIQRTSRGLLPACATVCPTQALTFGDLNDPTSEVSKLVASRPNRVLQPERGTHPNQFFLSR